MVDVKLIVSGYPLVKPVEIELDDEQAEVIQVWGEGRFDVLILGMPQARRIVRAWVEAPVQDEIVRAADFLSAADVFITALHMEGEINIGHWYGEDYWLIDMPFDFNLRLVDNEGNIIEEREA